MELNEKFLRDLHKCLMLTLPPNQQETFEQFIVGEQTHRAYEMADEMIKLGWNKTGHAI
jgi:hypothetical protein